MAYTDPLLSENPATVAAALWTAIDAARASKTDAQTGVDYYEGKHDILDNRIFYVNDSGHLVEDKFAANVRIAHPFLAELIDQKVSYLLSHAVEARVEDDQEFTDRLAEYYDEEFGVVLQDLLSGASQKGYEYVFARTRSDDRLSFQVADSLAAFPVYDADHEVARIVRSYEVKSTDENRQAVTLTRAEVWDAERVTFYVAEERRAFALDPAQQINPRPHVMAIADDGETMLGRSYGELPFYRLQNNLKETTDLAPIKAIIDDYDLMNAFLSNNLQDFTDALYVVKGYPSQDLDALRLNLKAKKAVSVGEGGDVDIRTVQIPVEGRTAKMDIDRENIYRFGMGFDSTQVGDGNITNIVIKSRYALLDMKANKAAARLRAALAWINRLVIDDINRRFGTAYDPAAVTFEFSRNTLVNEKDTADIEFVEAQAQAVKVNTVLAAAARFDDETTLRALCEVLDLDWEEVQDRLDDEAAEPLDDSTGLDPAQPVPGAQPPAQVPQQPGATAAVAAAEEEAGKTLNGAQTNSLLGVLAQLKSGELSRGQAIQVLSISIGVSKERAGQIIDGAEG